MRDTPAKRALELADAVAGRVTARTATNDAPRSGVRNAYTETADYGPRADSQCPVLVRSS